MFPGLIHTGQKHAGRQQIYIKDVRVCVCVGVCVVPFQEWVSDSG